MKALFENVNHQLDVHTFEFRRHSIDSQRPDSAQSEKFVSLLFAFSNSWILIFFHSLFFNLFQSEHNQ